jgi:hypothetical protein
MDPGNITDSLALYYEGGVTGGVKAGITFGNLSYGNTDTGVDFQIRAAGNLGPLQSRVGLLSGNDLNLRFNFQGNAGLGVGAGVDAIGSVRINFASAVNTFGRMFLGWMMSQGLPVSGFGN